MDKPEYSLYLNNGSASTEYFRTADPVVQKNEAIIWNRMKSNPKLFFDSMEEIESILMTDPMSVVYAPEIHVNLISPNYPCLIAPSSNKLSRVKDFR